MSKNILQDISGEDLVQELKDRGLFEKDSLVKWPAYSLAVEVLPIICVDIIPVRTLEGRSQVGLIIRATGSEAGKMAVAGGRILRNQKVKDAISKHLKNDLDVSDWQFHKLNGEEKPFYVQQYLHGQVAEKDFGFDPDKHSIGLTYLIHISQDPKPKNEAEKFEWIFEDQIPEVTGYNHAVVIKAAFKILK